MPINTYPCTHFTEFICATFADQRMKFQAPCPANVQRLFVFFYEILVLLVFFSVFSPDLRILSTYTYRIAKQMAHCRRNRILQRR